MPRPPSSPPPGAGGDALLGIALALARELRPRAPPRGLGLDDSLERDFGLDSLARVELVKRVEAAFGVELEGEAFAAAETPRDLLALVARGRPSRAPPVPAPAAPEEAVAMPPPEVGSIQAALDWHAERHGDRPSIRLLDDDGTVAVLAYRDLREDALALAAGLAARGHRPGERVAIMLPTGRAFLAAFYGTLYAGCVPVPLYPPTRLAQIEEHLKRVAGVVGDAGARLLLADERAKPLAAILRAGAPDLEAVATPADIARPGEAPPVAAVSPGDVALIQYTSGSTGNPKGVVLSHASLFANLRAMAAAGRVDSRDVFVSWLPLYHDMGLIGAVLGSMYVGFTLVLMSPLAFLARPRRWLEAIHAHRGTISAAPNFAYELCAAKLADADLEGLDLSSWRLAFNGAEPVSAATLERFAARCKPLGLATAALTPVYGLAEGSLGVAFTPPGRGPRVDRIDRRALADLGVARTSPEGEMAVVSGGIPIPGHEIRVVDSAGRELPERREGRVQFRGPSSTSGYYGNRQASAALFAGDWVNTGDLGYLAGGEVFITGREKDVIIRGGHNLHPQELEEAVGRLSGVRKGGVAVFAASDPALGTEKLVVLAETGLAGAEREALAAAISGLAVDLAGGPADDVVLAPPRTVRKTSSGKLRRAACRALYESGDLFRPPLPPWRQFLRLGGRAFIAGLRRRGQALADLAFAARAWGAVVLMTAVGAPVVLLLPGLPRRRRAGRRAAAMLLALAGLSPRREGEFLAGGRPVYVVNHASFVDAVALTALLPPSAYFVGKRELRQVFAIGTLLSRLGCHFIERDDPARGVAEADALTDLARAGESLVFFPEGGFDRAPGLRPFRHGAFVTAARAGRPVVPLALTGTRQVLRDGSWLPRRGTIVLHVCPPIAPGGDSWEHAVALAAAARQAILERLDEPDLG